MKISNATIKKLLSYAFAIAATPAPTLVPFLLSPQAQAQAAVTTTSISSATAAISLAATLRATQAQAQPSNYSGSQWPIIDTANQEQLIKIQQLYSTQEPAQQQLQTMVRKLHNKEENKSEGEGEATQTHLKILDKLNSQRAELQSQLFLQEKTLEKLKLDNQALQAKLTILSNQIFYIKEHVFTLSIVCLAFAIGSAAYILLAFKKLAQYNNLTENNK